MRSAPPAAPGPGAVFLKYWLPVLAYVGLIFSVSSLQSTGPTLFRWQDKVEHTVEYGLFGLLLGRAFRHGLAAPWSLPGVLGAMAAGSFVGAADEIYQRTVPGRTSDVRDWATDTAAVIAAVWITRLVAIRAARAPGGGAGAPRAARGAEGPGR